MPDIKVVAFCGSLRKDSYNKKLLKIAVQFANEAEVKVDLIDLKEINLPIYNADVEAAGFPENVAQFRETVLATDVVLIASPEHNYSITAALKNAIDWLSRGKPMPLDGKIAGIFGASTGPMGTLRGQFHLRHILTGVNVHTIPQPQVFIPFADSAFNEDGSLKNKTSEDLLRMLISRTFEYARKLK